MFSLCKLLEECVGLNGVLAATDTIRRSRTADKRVPPSVQGAIIILLT